MVQVLRLAAVLVLLIGGVAAIELLPQRGSLDSALTSAVDCVTRDHGVARAQAPAPAPVPGVGVQAAPGAVQAPAIAPAVPGALSAAECQAFLPSFFTAAVTLFATLILGALASLLYNTRRFREIMEQFASSAPAGR